MYGAYTVQLPAADDLNRDVTTSKTTSRLGEAALKIAANAHIGDKGYVQPGQWQPGGKKKRRSGKGKTSGYTRTNKKCVVVLNGVTEKRTVYVRDGKSYRRTVKNGKARYVPVKI